jgi:hypothetical protein
VQRIEQAVVHESAEQHDRAGDGHGDAKDECRSGCRAAVASEPVTNRRRQGRLTQRARHGDIANLPQILEAEVRSDAEHQEDDPEFGELMDRGFVAVKPGRERSERHAGHQIAHNGRKAETTGDESPDQRVYERDRGVEQEWEFRHVRP